jgi:hypothetical protein
MWKRTKVSSGSFAGSSAGRFPFPDGQEIGHMGQHEILQDVLLGGKVIVESAGLDTDVGRDLTDGDGGIAVAREQLQGRFAHTARGLVALSAGRLFRLDLHVSCFLPISKINERSFIFN